MNVSAFAHSTCLAAFCLVVGTAGPGRAGPPSEDPRQALGCSAVDTAAKQADSALQIARGAVDAKARESMSQKICRTSAIDVAGAAGGLLVLQNVAAMVNSLTPGASTFVLAGDFAASRVQLRKLAEQDCAAPLQEREKLWQETVRVLRAALAPSTAACGMDPKSMTTLFQP